LLLVQVSLAGSPDATDALSNDIVTEGCGLLTAGVVEPT